MSAAQQQLYDIRLLMRSLLSTHDSRSKPSTMNMMQE